MKVSSYICQIFLQNGTYFQAKNINFLLFDAVYFEYVTKVDHASKLKNNMKYTAHKNILAYESFQVYHQRMSEIRLQNGIFFMLEINLFIVDVLDFEDVTKPCIKT